LNKIIVLLSGLFGMLLCFGAMAIDESPGSDLTILRQDSGKNLSEMNISFLSIIEEFGAEGMDMGEAVKFKAPRSGWKLYGVQILGWSGYNKTTESYPIDKNFLLEIRDKDLHLLYRFADAQNGYFLSDQGPLYGVIEIPPLTVTEEFYVVFYDRGSMIVAMEADKGTGNSFLYSNGNLEPAQLTTATNETIGINWIIEAVGK